MNPRLTKSTAIIILTVLLLIPLSAFPIGRSGNGLISSVPDGFTANSPKFFDQSAPLPLDALKISAPTIRTASSSAAPQIELRRFSVEYANDVSLSRTDMRNKFAANGWWIASHADTCIEIYLSDYESASTAVVTWGMGKGVVILGAKNVLVKASIKSILDSLTLEPGACAWK